MPWLLGLLLNVLIIGLICYLIFWALRYLGAPDPIIKVVTVIVVVCAVIWAIELLAGGTSLYFVPFHRPY